MRMEIDWGTVQLWFLNLSFLAFVLSHLWLIWTVHTYKGKK